MFDLGNLNPAVRFYWDEETDEWVEFRVMADEDLRKLRKKCGRDKVEYRKVGKGAPQRFEYFEIDEDLLVEEINDFCIFNWRLLDTQGNEIPCTRENKNLLMGKEPRFAEWAAECLEQLRRDAELIKEKEEKN